MESNIVHQHGERIAGLEASYQHLATKDDISKLRLELEQSVNRLQANIDALKWVITLGIAGAAVLLGAVQVVLALALRG
ncbi:MAG: hypothetical protein J4G18_03400 [Anaerolineae bacterium]|nr:hypothetical protein [Anaerolineae bacterium]